MLGLSIRKHTKKIAVIGIVFVLGLFSVVPAIYPPSAYAAPANTPTGTGSNSDPTTCAIEKVGWILCPVIEIFGKIGDNAFSMLARMFLQTEPELVSDNSGTKLAWNMARDLANIMFVIAFLTIILSQVTGRGIDNYGIKRMLPRLVIAAIAVNASYYICQLAVDLSNIAGWEIKNFLVDIAHKVSSQAAMPIVQTSIDNQTSKGVLGHVGTLTVIAVAALALVGTVIYLLPALFSIILMVSLTCLIIIIILLLRKAIIVLLVVVSPVAFVLYLLPNTEKFFSRWMKMFGQLLMVFPVVALLFGGGQLASAIILVAGSHGNTGVYASGDKCVQLPSSNPNTSSTSPSAQAAVKNCGAQSTPLLLGLVASGIAVAPLIAVWSVLKGALAAAGAINGMVQNASKGVVGRSRQRLKEDMDYASSVRGRQAMRRQGVFGNGPVGAIRRRGINRKAIHDYEKGRYDKERVRYISEGAVNNNGELSRLGQKLAGYGSTLEDENRVLSNAENAQRQAQTEEFKAASVRAADMTDAQLNATVDVDLDNIDVNDPEVAAAIDELGKRGDFARVERIMNGIAGRGPSLASRTLASTLGENAGQIFTGAQLANISRGAHTESYMQTISQNMASGVLNEEKMATLGPGLANEISHVLATANRSGDPALVASSAAGIAQLADAAVNVQNDSILNKKISRIMQPLNNYASMTHVANNTRNRP